MEKQGKVLKRKALEWIRKEWRCRGIVSRGIAPWWNSPEMKCYAVALPRIAKEWKSIAKDMLSFDWCWN